MGVLADFYRTEASAKEQVAEMRDRLDRVARTLEWTREQTIIPLCPEIKSVLSDIEKVAREGIAIADGE